MVAPQAMVKGIQNTANDFMNNPQKVLQQAQKALGRLAAEYLWVSIILVLLGISWYYRRQVNKKANDNYAMESIYNDKPVKIGNINSADAAYKYDAQAGTGHLRDYYIASSYNSCCAGDFQDSYVDLVPLKEVIHQGARVLDFALYLVNGDVVVGAGPTNSDNIKGTYNQVPVSGPDGILSTINSYAFQSPCPNPNDPLFIHFRIKSQRITQSKWRSLAKAVKSVFKTRLLGTEFGYEGRPNSKGGGKNLAREPILNLRNKVIIICDAPNNNFRGTAFEELVNMSSGSPFLEESRNYDVQYSMPDLSSLNNNIPAQLHFSYGVQMVCMNYANNDSNMEFYRTKFNDARTAFVLKPDNLRYKIVTTTAPVKQNPKVKYAAKSINLPMYQGTI